MLVFSSYKAIVWIQEMLKIVWRSFEIRLWCFLVFCKIMLYCKKTRINSTVYGMMAVFSFWVNSSCRSRIWGSQHSCFNNAEMFLFYKIGYVVYRTIFFLHFPNHIFPSSVFPSYSNIIHHSFLPPIPPPCVWEFISGIYVVATPKCPPSVSRQHLVAALGLGAWQQEVCRSGFPLASHLEGAWAQVCSLAPSSILPAFINANHY